MSKAVDWYSEAIEFRSLCEAAARHATKPSEKEFTARMVAKACTHGLDTYVTSKQLAWLCTIARRGMPAPSQTSPTQRTPQ